MKHRLLRNLGRFFVVLLVLGGVAFCGYELLKPKPDPLAGWQYAYKEEPSTTIERDVQNYIRNLPQAQRGYIGTQLYYTNGTGEHAVSIEIFEGNRNASWQHVLFYDKNDKRVRSVRYGYRKYES